MSVLSGMARSAVSRRGETMKMQRMLVSMVAGLVAVGCGTHVSSLLLERRARGPLTEERGVAQGGSWQLDPPSQTQEQDGVEVSVSFASPSYLHNLFRNRQIFGQYASGNPFFPENIVFYVKVANHSQQRIRIDPANCVLIDDRGNQYAPLTTDYLDALEESHQPLATTTRGLLSEARPGYFGLSLPVGKIVTAKPQGRFALIKQSALQGGYLYAGVVYDGLISFWSPNRKATVLRLLISNVKTDFDPNDLPRKTLEFPFTFQVFAQGPGTVPVPAVAPTPAPAASTP